ncbi:MAG: GcrA cell cycle regulator [Rhizobiales bacterium]|nr:GcrA cell cycle regulator [Hyphomicrobiales bacterium]
MNTTEARAGWTDERVALLKRLWADGLSASQIAAELHHVTRNAVIGKVHRLGLSGRAKSPSSRMPRPRKPRASRLAPRLAWRGNTALAESLAPDAEPEIIADNVIPFGQRRTLLELNSEHCRWPIGDPQVEDFYFCGGRAIGAVPAVQHDGVVEIPYCAWHARMAYRPPTERHARASA